MFKNLFLLVILTWVSFSYAAQPVAQESLSEAQSYKVEKAVEEKDAQRAVAGAKIKKDKKNDKKKKVIEGEDSQEGQASDVQYWEYSE